jgi:RimJ/RimL family protein N-acetyltransferase
VWRIDALCDVDNHASARLLHALGFAHEGVLRRHSLHPNVSAEPRDVTVHARLRPDGA